MTSSKASRVVDLGTVTTATIDFKEGAAFKCLTTASSGLTVAISNAKEGVQAALYINEDDTENHALRKIDPASNIVTTIAGGHLGGDGDGGPAIDAGLERPHGCGIDKSGVIYIADSNNHRIRIFSQE